MITNERQYRITSAQLERIRKAITDYDIKAVAARMKSKALAKVELDAMRSEDEVLSAQLQEYETLRSGSVGILKASNLEELPTILIKARIAKGLSQRQLAELIGVREQQVQRYLFVSAISQSLTLAAKEILMARDLLHLDELSMGWMSLKKYMFNLQMDKCLFHQ